MQIAIIGAGNVGCTLGKRWRARGHDVTIGVREPSPAKEREVRERIGQEVRVVSVSKAAEDAGIIVFATPWGATESAIRACGELANKIVLDCTNPLSGQPIGLELGHQTSGAERIAGWARGARVVKIFNTTGSNNMSDPHYGSERATMFFCGDDADARVCAASLAADLGFEPVDAGALAEARLLEPLAMLWIRLAHVQGLGREIAFRLMRR
jgi:predicted dinucleotide-binding enzyme